MVIAHDAFASAADFARFAVPNSHGYQRGRCGCCGLMRWHHRKDCAAAQAIAKRDGVGSPAILVEPRDVV